MFYCEKCMMLSEKQDKCENCGHKKLRIPADNDFVYLTNKDAIWSEMLEDALKENGIVYSKRSFLGAGIVIQLGYNFESYDFFVPFEMLDAAKKLEEDLFSAVKTSEFEAGEDDIL